MPRNSSTRGRKPGAKPRFSLPPSRRTRRPETSPAIVNERRRRRRTSRAGAGPRTTNRTARTNREVPLRSEGLPPMTTVNRRITLAARPVGFPKVSDFRLDYSPLPSLSVGEVLVRSVYLSLDPYMRARMNAAASYAPPVALGEVMGGGAVGLVLQTENPRFLAGDAVEGMLGWQEYAAIEGRELRQIDPALAPISTALGVLGRPGLTAYFGLLDLCQPQRGETVVVSGAAGAVGMLVGQIAKIKGCRVVGIASSDAKVSWLIDELGFDAALNDKPGEDLKSRLRDLCPDG